MHIFSYILKNFKRRKKGTKSFSIVKDKTFLKDIKTWAQINVLYYYF